MGSCSELPSPPQRGGAGAAAAAQSESSSGEAPTWWRPTSLDDLLALKEAYPSSRLVAGNSEVGIESRFKNVGHATFIFGSAIEELRKCTSGASTMELGACAPLSDIEKLAGKVGAERAGSEGEAAGGGETDVESIS